MGCSDSKEARYAVVNPGVQGRGVQTNRDERTTSVPSKTHQQTQHQQTQTSEVDKMKYPLQPPKKRKLDIIKDPAIFKNLDNNVRNMSREHARTMPALAQHLMALSKSDLEMIRAFFCWLAYNIAYDTESSFSGKKQPQSVDSVLQSRKAVCQGYANVFLALCKEAKIGCLLVSGFSKGHGYDPETIFTANTKTDHAWNLVYVLGEWRPLDCTWSTGFRGEDGKFKRQFDEHWFLTDPEEFLPKHFPFMDGNVKASEALQLMKRPVSMEQFSRSACPWSYAYSLGLQLVSHQNSVIDVTGDVTITMKAGRRPLESVDVTLQERTAAGITQLQKHRSGLLASLNHQGVCTIYVRPPRAGTFLLRLMGRGAGEQDENILLGILDYVIKCHKAHPIKYPMPDKKGYWGLRHLTATECGLKPPLKILFNADKGRVDVPVPLSRVTTLSAHLYHAGEKETQLNEYTFISHTSTRAVIHARLPRPGYYKLSIFAMHPEQVTLPQVADVLVFADTACSDCQTFPKVFPFAHQERAQLKEPLVGQVSRHRTWFRMRAPTLGVAKVGDTMMVKKGDTWEVEMTPPKGQDTVTVYGALENNASSLKGLFQFLVV